MDVSTIHWISEMELIEDPQGLFCGQWQMEGTVDPLDFNFGSFYSDTNSDSTSVVPIACPANPSVYSEASAADRPLKQIKTNNWAAESNSSSTSHVTSFRKYCDSPPSATSQQWYGNLDCVTTANDEPAATVPSKSTRGGSNAVAFPSFPNSEVDHDQYPIGNFHHGGGGVPAQCQATAAATAEKTAKRSLLHAHDHVMAERKRRQKLGQLYIELSANVPGLKKTDKASVLGDAIKHLKHLQERVSTLEEQTRKRKMESVVFVKKSMLASSHTDNHGGSESEQPLPEIEAKVSDKNVLIRIHCEKQKGSALKLIMSEIENLSLTVVSSSMLPFGDCTVDVTVIAKMDDDFNMTMKGLVNRLRLAILNNMSQDAAR